MKTIKNFIYELFAEKGKVSSIRVGLISTIFMAAFLVGCIGFYMIKKTMATEGVIDWGGIGTLLAAIALFLSPVLAAKVVQKKDENV